MTMDDMELVRQYAQHGSEEAFATLVSRYVNLVYSVALRQLRDASLAEEVTQATFIILARKADSLGPKTILSAWLCRTAQYAATRALRTQQRRQNREQEGYMQSLLNQPEPENSPWLDIAPLLDTAMAQLGEKDHSAIVLRFFEGKDLKQVGTALGVNENTAKTRVSRAMEKLRKFFVKRGITLSAAVIGGAISANSVQAAPAALAKSVTAVVITKGATVSSSTLTIIKGALKLMAWTKAKTAVVVGVAAILAVGTTTGLVEVTAPDIQGAWEATVIDKAGGGVQAGELPKTRIVMKITKTNGSYQTTVEDIDQGNKAEPISKFAYNFHSVYLEFPGGSYHGTVNLTGTKISGASKWNKNSIELVFNRTAHPAPFPEPLTDGEFAPRAGSDLQGYWKGMIGTGKGGLYTGLSVCIKIAEASDGTYRADFYCPDPKAHRQPTSVSFDGTTVKLLTMAGYGMFEGELRNDNTELVGNWIQKGQYTPTTFARANWTKP